MGVKVGMRVWVRVQRSTTVGAGAGARGSGGMVRMRARFGGEDERNAKGEGAGKADD